MMSTNSFAMDTGKSPRILIVSVRGFRFQAANCCIYELEDLLMDLESAQLYQPIPDRNFDLARKIYRGLKYLGSSHSVAGNLAPFTQELVLEHEYDLLFAVLDNPWQFHLLNTIKGWRDKCRHTACFITEMWRPELEDQRLFQEPWSHFDHIFLGVTECVADLSKLIEPPVTYVPPAVDTLRFSPYPNPPQRFIDVSYVGRRSPDIHQALVKRASKDNFFYYHDTLRGKLEIGNPQQHRILLANLFQRSRYNITNYAKFNSTEETGGTQEIGYRFFEGAAAGTVMVGLPPAGDAFPRYFDWQDPIIKVDLSGTDVVEAIAELDAQPERLEQISRRNVAHCLLKHDWSYRWRDMLATFNLKPSTMVIERQKYLHELANSILTEIDN
ncbi:MAG: glycosyltransferase [Cyanobacteria bacterium P01_A01_bin.83]